MSAPFRGLTWDHPRGYRALEAAAAADPVVTWDRQPLEGFESHPIADLCARYDLVVLDHPHLGEAIEENCLSPVEDWFPKQELDRIRRDTIGPALESYAWSGHHWALPLDVATQVMARDPERVPEAPDTWDDVERLSGRVPVALSVAGPHAVLTFLSLCVSLGALPGGPDLVEDDVGAEALARMARLAARAPAGSEVLNPIGLLEAMASNDRIALVPLVFGYVPYASAHTGRRRVAFSEAPRIAPGGRRGSVLGGTGIGLSRKARPTGALVQHLSRLMSTEMQTTFISDHDGQPSSRLAWTSSAVNERAGDFYGATLETAETAWVRPRFDGWIAFQTAASARIRAALADDGAPKPVLDDLRRLWRQARTDARGDLDDRSLRKRPMTAKALSDVTVLDFSHLLQGPFCTQLLADMGARVIKVERPGQGDLFRTMTFNNKWVGGKESPNFLAWNRNKRSLAVDLKSPAAKTILYKIAEKADVVVQNFRPGVLAKLGFGYEDFRKVNPRIIYCSGSGYGESGPYLSRPGQDMLIQGLTGIAAATGRGDGPPVPVGSGFSDQVGAMNMVYGILSALYWRERSGEGQEIKVDLLSGMLAHQGQEMLMAMNFHEDFKRPNSGIGHPGMEAPFGVYPTSDGWVTIAMSPYTKLVGVLGDDSLLEFNDPKSLFDKRDEIWERIAALTKTWTTADLLEAMLAVDIWCGEVKTHLKASEDPQVRHMGMIAEYEHPTAGTVKVVAPAVKMSRTPATIDRPAPLVGEHSREILREFGWSESEIADFEAAGVIGLSTT